MSYFRSTSNVIYYIQAAVAHVCTAIYIAFPFVFFLYRVNINALSQTRIIKKRVRLQHKLPSSETGPRLYISWFRRRPRTHHRRGESIRAAYRYIYQTKTKTRSFLYMRFTRGYRRNRSEIQSCRNIRSRSS